MIMDNYGLSENGQTKNGQVKIELETIVRDGNQVQHTTDQEDSSKNNKGDENSPNEGDELQKNHDDDAKKTEFEFELENSNNAVTTEFQARKFPQLLAAFAALTGAFSYGCIMGYAAVSMPKLRQDPNFPHPTEDEISWMSASVNLGALMGCLPTGFAIDIIGRRMTMIILTIPFVVGWLCIYFARNVLVFIIGRFITGFCGGAFMLVAPIFIAEATDPDIRGGLITCFDLICIIGVVSMNVLGISYIKLETLIVYRSIVGKFLEWHTQALAVGFIPLLSFAILLCVPESPRFLVSQGKEQEAFNSLCWFQGASNSQGESVKPKFYALLDDIAQTESEKTSPTGLLDQLREYKQESVLKAFLLIFLLFLFRELSGIVIVDFYSIDIFNSVGFNGEQGSISAYTLVIFMHSTTLIFLTVAAFLMDRVNRKLIVVPCQFLQAISFAALGAFFYIKEQNPELAENHFKFVPPVALFLFTIGHVSGIGPIPLIIMPEILSQRIRATASTVLITTKWTTAFLLARYFKNYIDLVGEPAGYWTFSAICFSALLFVLIFLPSNEGKTLEQIQMERKGI